MDYRISIDPGLDAGFALWDEATWTQCVAPLHAGLWRGRGAVWQAKAHSIANQFEAEICAGGCAGAYCEFPTFYDNPGGHMVAKRGDLGKLYYVIGALGQVADRLDVPFTLISVPEWKGQLPKHVVNARIADRLGVSELLNTLRLHAWDAVGIGLYAKGHF